MYKAGDEDGRLQSLVVEHEVGTADPELPTRYFTVPWRTHKFTNPLAKAVADFDPERADPDENDYRPADGTQPSRQKVLIWARPHSVGAKADGRDARLYFAYSDMPEHGPNGPVGWNPRYLSAIDRGRPVFSDDPSDAIALDLGGDPLPESEHLDVVDRAAVSYLAELDQWVMFYGGDFAPIVLLEFFGPNYERVERDPMGAIHARFARHPWGPWSAPLPVFAAGDASADPPRAGSEYASGGALYHHGCRDPGCIPTSPAPIFRDTPYGFLYGPNIFDCWTEAREDGSAADVYWNVSTWNPYQVILLRTRIRR
jgi:hypothetical protein